MSNIIAQDPAAVLEAKRIQRQLNNMIQIADASIVRVKCLVGPQASFNPAPSDGGRGRDGNSRFRCKHFLTSAPNIVYVMREDTTEDDHPSQLVNPRPGGDKDTVTHAMVLINTDHPIGDENYSYFTIGFPMSGWHEHDITVGSSAPDIQRSFTTNPATQGPANKWGDIRGAVINDHGNQEFATSSWEWRISDASGSGSRRVFEADTTTTGDQQANLSVFFQQYQGTFVTVRVFSAIIDGLSFDALGTPYQSSPAPVRHLL